MQVTYLSVHPQTDHTYETDTNEDYPLSLPTPWQSYIVSSVILSHLSYFGIAKCYFDYAANISTESTREYCIARLAVAEASIEIGDRMGRIQAMRAALDTAAVAPLSLSS